MRHFYGIAVLLLSNLWGAAHSQSQSTDRPPVFFSTVPYDLQLFARDSANQAIVPVAGYVNKVGYQRIRLLFFREGKLLTVSTKILNPADTLTAFRFEPRIRAERAQYSFQVFLYRTVTDSVLVIQRQRLVCGDVLVLDGQSNAAGVSGWDAFSSGVDDTYLRNYTFPPGNTPVPEQLSWYPAKEPYATVGIFGLSLQKQILDTYGIPTALFNGAVGGANLLDLSRRNADLPTDVNTYYGQLLVRLRQAGLDQNVRAVIWRQGENESGSPNPSFAKAYPANFTRFYQQLRQDLGSKFHLYIAQLNLLTEGNSQSGALREFQRQAPSLFTRTAAMSTVGCPGYDGLHYLGAGYLQQSQEVFRQLQRDLYGSRDTLQIDAPSVQKIFRNARRDTLTLVFQPDQQLRWPADLTLTNPATGFVYQRRLADVFYFDGQPALVRSGSAEANRITLVLTAPSQATALTYLPPWFSDPQSGFYNGPHPTNGRGLRAFSFDQVPVIDALSSPILLTISNSTPNLIQLKWTLPTEGTIESLRLERAIGDSAFVFRATLPPTTLTYVDNTPADRRESYRYRLIAVNRMTESAPSNMVTAGSPVLGLPEPPPPPVYLYPNPVASGGILTIGTKPSLNVVGLRLLDVQGRTVHAQTGTGQAWPLPALATGLYVAEITLASEQVVHIHVLVR